MTTKKTTISKVPSFKRLNLKNFRGFKSLKEIELAPLTYLVGPNSSGKTSLFDSLLFIIQNDFDLSANIKLVPSWTGPLVDLGSFSDTVFGHDSNLKIEIDFIVSGDLLSDYIHKSSRLKNRSIRVSFTFKTSGEDRIGTVSKLILVDVRTGEKLEIRYYKSKISIKLFGIVTDIPIPHPSGRHDSLLSQEVHKIIRKQRKRGVRIKLLAWKWITEFFEFYGFGPFLTTQRVSSGRSAPKRWYSISEFSKKRERLFRGLEPKVFDSIDPALITDVSGEEFDYFSKRKKITIPLTLDKILSDIDISNKIESFSLSPYHLAIRVKDKHTNIVNNLMDIGYGASQAIPVIKACLSKVISPLFVEQPEIHLHPKAQGVIADLLALTSRHRQVIVETHSVRMINRARILVAKGEISAKDVIVHYVGKDREGSFVKTLKIKPNGDFIGDWPEGYFDERYEDTMQLLKLKSGS